MTKSFKPRFAARGLDRALAARAPLGLLLAAGVVAEAGAQPPPPAEELIAAQRTAMQPLAAFDGVWRGTASVVTAAGQRQQIVQTERVGPLLDGAIRVIEGRGYGADGQKGFNAFAVLSYSPQSKTYTFSSHAQGHAGEFPLEVQPNGFRWQIPAGPATIRYTAVVENGVWNETGERIVEGQPPARIFEMSLRRVGATDWPAAGALEAK